MFRRQKGFTLIELLIVVIILGILAVLAIPRFMANRDEARLNTCRANMRMIDDAVERAAFENAPGGFATVQALAAGNYLKRVPVCPTTNTNTYSITGRNADCSNAGHDPLAGS